MLLSFKDVTGPSMKSYRRYAIYFAPREGQFLDALEAWLGRSARSGVEVPHLALSALAAQGIDQAAITEAPRRYGAHATLKAPFRLADGQRPEDLRKALIDFARGQTALELEALSLNRIGSFFALTPVGDTAKLNAFAFEIVQKFHPFAALLSPDEIARRRPEKLSPRQRELLARWSYPHVAEEFRFHITLTGKLAPESTDLIHAELTALFAPLLPKPFLIEDLCLFGETETGDFELIERIPLLGAS